MAIKEVVDDAAVAVDGVRRVRRWTNGSTAKVLLVLSLVGMILVGLQAIYVTYNLQKLQDSTRTYTASLRILGDKLAYEAAIDAISACITADPTSNDLRKFYCNEASYQFKLRTNELKYPGAEEVYGRHAYVGMRNLLLNRQRGLALTQLESLHNAARPVLFNTFLSGTGIIVAVVLTGLLMLGVFVYLVLPGRAQVPGA